MAEIEHHKQGQYNPANLSRCCQRVRFRDTIKVRESSGKEVVYGSLDRCSGCFGASGAFVPKVKSPELKLDAVVKRLGTGPGRVRGSLLDANQFGAQEKTQRPVGVDSAANDEPWDGEEP